MLVQFRETLPTERPCVKVRAAPSVPGKNLTKLVDSLGTSDSRVYQCVVLLLGAPEMQHPVEFYRRGVIHARRRGLAVLSYFILLVSISRRVVQLPGKPSLHELC